MRKKSKGEKIYSVVDYVLLSLLGVCFVLPYVLILVMSVTSTESYYHKGYSLFPESLTWEGYRMIFRRGSEIYTAFYNTIVITVLGTAIGMFCTTLTAYALSKRYLLGRRLFNGLIVFAMLFSGGLIPSFLLLSALNMLNTYWSIVVPGALTPWYCILIRTYFHSIPDSLEESAQAGRRQRFCRAGAHLSAPLAARAGHGGALFHRRILESVVGVRAVFRQHAQGHDADRGHFAGIYSEQYAIVRFGRDDDAARIHENGDRRRGDPADRLHLSVFAEILYQRPHGRFGQRVNSGRFT